MLGGLGDRTRVRRQPEAQGNGHKRGSLQRGLYVALGLLVVLVTIPAVFAGFELAQMRRDNARAGHAVEALAGYLRLQALGYEVDRMAAGGMLQEEYARDAMKASLARHAEVIARSTAEERRLIQSGLLTAREEAERLEEERLQQRMLDQAMQALGNRIDGGPEGDWKPAIAIAISGEGQEVRAAQERGLRSFQLAQWAFAGIAGAIALAALAVLAWFRGHVLAPLHALLRSTEQLGRGEYKARTEPTGPWEFRLIAASFNAMAANIESASLQLQSTNSRLASEVRNRTADLEAANAALARLDARRRDFLADTGHELRTPLAVLRGEADIALRAPAASAEDLRASIGRIARIAAMLGRLVDDLLAVARAEAPVREMDRERVDLVALVCECIDEFAFVFSADQGAIAICQSDASLIAEIDRGRIAQVLRILVDNAIKYCADAPEVCFRLRAEGDSAVITLTDNGIGVAEEDVPHLLQRFRRSGERGTAGRAEGLGLGLPIAVSIIEAHGGTLALAPAPGQGTVATITLPLAEKATDRGDAEIQARLAVAGTGRTIPRGCAARPGKIEPQPIVETP